MIIICFRFPTFFEWSVIIELTLRVYFDLHTTNSIVCIPWIPHGQCRCTVDVQNLWHFWRLVIRLQKKDCWILSILNIAWIMLKNMYVLFNLLPVLIITKKRKKIPTSRQKIGRFYCQDFLFHNFLPKETLISNCFWFILVKYLPSLIGIRKKSV